jgi:cytochrome b subunit of formate dehydrogenase
MTQRVAGELLQAQGKQVRRFTLIWRIAHLCFALSVMVLVLTGMALFYDDTSWAPYIMLAFGGPKIAGNVHRIFAAILLGIFFLHLIAVLTNIARNRKTFNWFGPDSLLPNWQDVKDVYGMFKWFFGKSPRPSFDKWTYFEKFDYLAEFWGMSVIGTTGVILVFPNVAASFMPGWIFNVAPVVHGVEAFIAAVFLFTVHFFNNHFRPEKFPPPDVVMFTGSVPLEEFKHERPVQYARMVEAGELEENLVDKPAPAFTLGARILGLVLIALGLTLLLLILLGFVTALQR